MTYAIVLAATLLSSAAIAQVGPSPSQRSPADGRQESQLQPDENQAALTARKRGRIEMMIGPSGKRSECNADACPRFEWKPLTPGR